VDVEEEVGAGEARSTSRASQMSKVNIVALFPTSIVNMQTDVSVSLTQIRQLDRLR
jgi:hypothetical protein